MSDLSVTTGFAYNKNAFAISISAATMGATLAGAGVVSNVQAVGFAAHEALILGEVATPGLSWFKNLDATNFVEIGYDTTGTFRPVVRLNVGDPPAVFRFSASRSRLS